MAKRRKSDSAVSASTSCSVGGGGAFAVWASCTACTGASPDNGSTVDGPAGPACSAAGVPGCARCCGSSPVDLPCCESSLLLDQRPRKPSLIATTLELLFGRDRRRIAEPVLQRPEALRPPPPLRLRDIVLRVERAQPLDDV